MHVTDGNVSEAARQRSDPGSAGRDVSPGDRQPAAVERMAAC
jgi:hypothetical protein